MSDERTEAPAQGHGRDFGPTGKAGLLAALREQFQPGFDAHRRLMFRAAVAYGRVAIDDDRPASDERFTVLTVFHSASRALYWYLDDWAQLGQVPELCPGCPYCELIVNVLDYGDARRRDDQEAIRAHGGRMLALCRELAEIVAEAEAEGNGEAAEGDQ